MPSEYISSYRNGSVQSKQAHLVIARLGFYKQLPASYLLELVFSDENKHINK